MIAGVDWQKLPINKNVAISYYISLAFSERFISKVIWIYFVYAVASFTLESCNTLCNTNCILE